MENNIQHIITLHENVNHALDPVAILHWLKTKKNKDGHLLICDLELSA